MQAQARICPICIDDHSADRACTSANLVERIETLRAENARLTADLSKLRDDLETLIQQRDEAQRRRGEIEAECEALRADVVWVCKTPEVGEQVERIMKIATPLDADILRAVREAREG